MEQNQCVYTIPVGYVFRPEPEELLWFLVESIKLQDQWVRPPEIRNLDLYGKDSNPWTLFDGSSDKPCYVMTRLERKVTGKSKFKRTAGVGTWKEQKSSDVTLRLEDGVNLKGLKRYFCFVPNDRKDSSYGRWIMNEYSLLQYGLDDYVVCEIHKKPSSKRKLVLHDDDDDTHNQVLVKKMRTSGHDDGDGERVDLVVEDDVVPSTPGDQEVLMNKSTHSISNNCEDDDDQDLINLIEREVEGGVDDIAVCDSLSQAPVAVSDHDRQGMISIHSVDPFQGHDHGCDSIAKTDSCVPAKQSYLPPFDIPDELWNTVHMQESTASTCGHDDDYLGRLIVDGPDDLMPWVGLGFSMSDLNDFNIVW